LQARGLIVTDFRRSGTKAVLGSKFEDRNSNREGSARELQILRWHWGGGLGGKGVRRGEGVFKLAAKGAAPHSGGSNRSAGRL
jgi:hypothetical protein